MLYSRPMYSYLRCISQRLPQYVCITTGFLNHTKLNTGSVYPVLLSTKRKIKSNLILVFEIWQHSFNRDLYTLFPCTHDLKNSRRAWCTVFRYTSLYTDLLTLQPMNTSLYLAGPWVYGCAWKNNLLVNLSARVDLREPKWHLLLQDSGWKIYCLCQAQKLMKNDHLSKHHLAFTHTYRDTTAQNLCKPDNSEFP